ncbi:ABC transporter ATP-binding protein [Oceanobacter sp. 4_MG-2023]|uniref:ABC transporter ATP-binding protein n=1 Tax=Oceanobacter sp. 4_MG-2023 TaxID=3062623 RepID=UPI0027366CFD|nr:ABC transporter ATP-binding protein [Oceanobacter sp. 4_MG-2023]MDP2548321.1 ABC transporter ATP-binding protein [Oceanobacter sp. 4_MG-2023]
MVGCSGLAVNKLVLTIDQQPILKQISFALKRGSVLGVLGPNGAGKTSLLLALSGQLSGAGTVCWRDQLVADYRLSQRARRIAVVHQLNDTVFALSLRQMVRMGLLPHQSWLGRQTQEDDQCIEQALDRVGLATKADQVFASLSGGEQQRGLIARALVQRAELIVLDEPVNHLDVYYQHDVLALLGQLARDNGLTVVMSLHDLNLSAHYCDQLLLLDHGEQVAYGTPSQVLEPERLQQVFRLPCAVRHDAGALRVDFSPPAPMAQTVAPTEQDQAI